MHVSHATPVITQQPGPLTNSVSIGATLTNRVLAGTSSLPLRYQWRLNSNELAGATNALLVLTNIQISDGGLYTVVVSDATGAIQSNPWTVEVDATFTKITGANIVSVSGFGSAWADYDRDGFPDLFIGTTFGNPTGYSPNELYHNRQDGTFELVPAAAFPADIGGIGASWADYDNDGFLDLFVSKTGADAFYHNNGNGTFSKITNAATMENAAGWASPWVDFNNDGLVDLFVANESSPNALFQNTGNGTFLKIANWTPTGTLFSQGAAWGDYDNDGLPDLVVANYLGNRNLLYHNEGSGRFTSISNSPVLSTPAESSVPAWGDYDNDGYLDLFIGTPRSTNSALFHNNRDGTLTLVTNSPVTADRGSSQGAAWGDYDNDGHLDLLVAGARLYHGNGHGTFTRITSGSLANEGASRRTCAWVDYNRDGFLDVWVARTSGNLNGLYKNNGNSNQWLAVQCEGRTSNRAGIGAKLRIQAMIGGRRFWQMRQITSSELTAHFGLGDATIVEIVRIEWPFGVVQQLTDVAARQFLSLVEPLEVAISPASLQLQAGAEARFTFQTTLEPPLHLQWYLNGFALAEETNINLIIPNVQRADAGHYTASVVDFASGSSVITRAAILSGPAVISQQPLSQQVRVGSNVTFSVTTTGFGPLTTQWRWNGTNIAAATSNVLTLTNVQIANEGSYSVIISDSYGSISSSNATLAALARPQITAPPLSQSVVAGGNITLSASAIGYPFPLTFRWLRNGLVVSNMVLAETNCFITFTNIQPPVPPNQLSYRVVVTNLAGNISSANVLITVLPDTDGDGLPDEWETAQDLNPNDDGDASQDVDGDGMTNLAEYLARTNPNDAGSRLQMELRASNADTLTIRFLAASNQTYRLEHRDAVDFGTWTPWIAFTASPTNRWWECDPWPLTNSTREFFRVVAPNQ
jgi:enediyne biosynthesis protein E4